MDLDDLDFFTDESLAEDPYPYFERLRSRCPVWREPHHGVVAVTGYDEAVAVYRDHETFSSCNAPIGPFPGLPFEPDGDDIGPQIERYRGLFPMNEHLVTFDPPRHTAHRELLRRLLTPRRTKENEDFMWQLADRQIGEFTQPSEFKIDRPNVREHIAFGRGIHSCPGGPLARTEARISVERLLDRMADIRICEVEHGPADSRRFAYDPTYILRGIRSLHLEYRPIT